jgi:uncharacterized lipoprotein YmbA
MKSPLWLFLCGLLVSACSSEPTLYHTLSLTSASPAPISTTSTIRSLGVGPVKLPTLLDREGMVIRRDAITAEVSDTHLWGGQLEDEFLSALTQHLQNALPTSQVLQIPWEVSQTPQYQVVVRLDQFDGIPGKQAVLRGLWQLQNGADGRILSSHPVSLQRKPAKPGVDGLVEAQSLLVADLAAQIVNSLPQR